MATFPRRLHILGAATALPALLAGCSLGPSGTLVQPPGPDPDLVAALEDSLSELGTRPVLRYAGELDPKMGATDGTLIDPAEPTAIDWRVTAAGIGYGETTVDGYTVTILATEDQKFVRASADYWQDRHEIDPGHSERIADDWAQVYEQGWIGPDHLVTPHAYAEALRAAMEEAGVFAAPWPKPEEDRYRLSVGKGAVLLNTDGTIAGIENVTVDYLSGTGIGFTADVDPKPGAVEVDRFRTDVSAAMMELDEYYYSTPNVDLNLSLDDWVLECDDYADCEIGAKVTAEVSFIYLTEERLKHIDVTFTGIVSDDTLGEEDCTKDETLDVGETAEITCKTSYGSFKGVDYEITGDGSAVGYPVLGNDTEQMITELDETLD